MVSQIDPSVPVFGSPTTASVRNNFLIAKNEITALQAAIGITLPLPVTSGGTGANDVIDAQINLGILPITGGTMTGLLRLSGNPTDVLGATPKQYVDSYFPVSISNGGTGANNATQALANLGAVGLNSPAFTGIPTAPTPPTSDSSTIIATTAFVHSVLGGTSIVNNVSGANGITVSPNIGNVVVSLQTPVTIANGGTGAASAPAALAALGGAPLASPVFTGVPAGPTAAPGANTTQLATTAFVTNALGGVVGSVSSVSGGNGISVNQTTGAVIVTLSTPVTIANGGTGANTGGGALDSLLGTGANANGYIQRQANGAYTLVPFIGQFIGDTPPNNPVVGQLWWDSVGGQLYIFFNDGNSSQWVVASNLTGGGMFLPLVGGTLTGPLIVQNGGMLVGNTGVVPSQGGLLLNANALAPVTPAAGTILQLNGPDGLTTSLEIDSFGNYAQLELATAGGTNATKAAIANTNVIGNVAFAGWNGTAFSRGAQIFAQATQNWTGAAQGTQLSFLCSPNGSTSLGLVGSVNTINGWSLLGTQTNDNAPAGWIGETMDSIVAGPGITLTNNVTANITSLALTAGDWDVAGEGWIAATGAGTLVNISLGMITLSATLPTGPAVSQARVSSYDNEPAPTTLIFPIGPMRISLGATTTLYLVTQVGFSATACTAYGKLEARRRR